MLHFAVLGGSAVTVEALCKRTDLIDVNCMDDDGLTALHMAASLGAVDIIDVLLDTPSINLMAGGTPESPMHCACAASAKADPLRAVRRLGQEWQRKHENLPLLCTWLGRPCADVCMQGAQQVCFVPQVCPST